MGGFLGIGGSSAKTDRSNVLTGFSNLKNVFSFGLPTAQSSIGGAANYWNGILSGSRTAMTQAVAPETNATLAQSDAQKRQASTMGTGRGGGTAGANQQRSTDVMAKIDNLLFGARPEAAKSSAALGTNLLGTSTTAADNLTQNAITARKEDYAINQDMVSKVTSAIGSVLRAFF